MPRMTGLAVTAAAVIGSHHSAAIFAASPPIFSGCLFLSGAGRRVTEEEAMRAARGLGRGAAGSFECRTAKGEERESGRMKR